MIPYWYHNAEIFLVWYIVKELFNTHSQLSPYDIGGLSRHVSILALQGAHVADVASGCIAVVPQHRVLVLWAFPLREVTQRLDQGVSREHWQLQMVFDVLFAQRHLTLQAHFKGWSFFSQAAVAEHIFGLYVLRIKIRYWYLGKGVFCTWLLIKMSFTFHNFKLILF